MRIGIAGVTGRVGQLLVDEVRSAGATLIGGTGRPGSMPGAGLTGIRLYDSLELLAAEIDTVIDFTHPDTAIAHARIAAEAGIAWVLGTTGLSMPAQAAVEQAARSIAVVQAANFSPGVTLVLELAGRLAAALPAVEYDAEILEMHHGQKIDAPSGTALAIGRAVADARGVALDDVRGHGGVGPRKPGAIGFASLRGGQVVGDHTLLLTAGDEQISLTHRAFDRRVFASGAVRAALWTKGHAPGLYGMKDVLALR